MLFRSRRIAVIAAQKKRDEAERLVQDVPSEIAAKIAESEAVSNASKPNRDNFLFDSN